MTTTNMNRGEGRPATFKKYVFIEGLGFINKGSVLSVPSHWRDLESAVIDIHGSDMKLYLNRYTTDLLIKDPILKEAI